MKPLKFCTALRTFICSCDFNLGSGKFTIIKGLKYVRRRFNQNFAVFKRRSFCCDPKIRAIYICTHLFTYAPKRVWRLFCSLRRQNRKFIIVRDSQCQCRAFRVVKTQKVFVVSKSITRLFHRRQMCFLKIYLDVEKQPEIPKYIQARRQIDVSCCFFILRFFSDISFHA
jgi:hypothetical protein